MHCEMPTARVPAHAARWQTMPVDVTPEDDLPLDPRIWSRHDVGVWASRCGGCPGRFPMNGKALCLMTRDMFAAREPGRAEFMLKDFRRRLSRALALQELLEKLRMSSK